MADRNRTGGSFSLIILPYLEKLRLHNSQCGVNGQHVGLGSWEAWVRIPTSMIEADWVILAPP